jgi:hypothetical protein
MTDKQREGLIKHMAELAEKFKKDPEAGRKFLIKAKLLKKNGELPEGLAALLK